MRALRRRAGVRVEEAAAAIKVSRATVWRMERGTCGAGTGLVT